MHSLGLLKKIKNEREGKNKDELKSAVKEKWSKLKQRKLKHKDKCVKAITEPTSCGLKIKPFKGNETNTNQWKGGSECHFCTSAIWDHMVPWISCYVHHCRSPLPPLPPETTCHISDPSKSNNLLFYSNNHTLTQIKAKYVFESSNPDLLSLLYPARSYSLLLVFYLTKQALKYLHPFVWMENQII